MTRKTVTHYRSSPYFPRRRFRLAVDARRVWRDCNSTVIKNRSAKMESRWSHVGRLRTPRDLICSQWGRKRASCHSSTHTACNPRRICATWDRRSSFSPLPYVYIHHMAHVGRLRAKNNPASQVLPTRTLCPTSPTLHLILLVACIECILPRTRLTAAVFTTLHALLTALMMYIGAVEGCLPFDIDTTDDDERGWAVWPVGVVRGPHSVAVVVWFAWVVGVGGRMWGVNGARG
ncbi:uncharacterized protein EV422DRAFT_213725 [Fimicolochytrium jonesii]|uniref:uncharacterized protein n=1 Tax=Fimicolochytrium jonesii TaxID=1396493 RepID=UPI0022FDEABB|nr:uncharacterized protein EV422DRAFT_213725 [Fimicolochytrium jonesii]KAI8817723.1 hypothetical protein EV422DRAFT_213725 [Fimicolochytrium jonesii]